MLRALNKAGQFKQEDGQLPDFFQLLSRYLESPPGTRFVKYTFFVFHQESRASSQKGDDSRARAGLQNLAPGRAK